MGRRNVEGGLVSKVWSEGWQKDSTRDIWNSTWGCFRLNSSLLTSWIIFTTYRNTKYLGEVKKRLRENSGRKRNMSGLEGCTVQNSEPEVTLRKISGIHTHGPWLSTGHRTGELSEFCLTHSSRRVWNYLTANWYRYDNKMLTTWSKWGKGKETRSVGENWRK